jgi:hypothetical protein
MKIAFFLALILQCSVVTEAKEKKPMGKLETNIKLNGSLIQGKGLKPMLLDTLSEQDKYLEDLVGLRKDFQDRIEKDKNRKSL